MCQHRPGAGQTTIRRSVKSPWRRSRVRVARVYKMKQHPLRTDRYAFPCEQVWGRPSISVHVLPRNARFLPPPVSSIVYNADPDRGFSGCFPPLSGKRASIHLCAQRWCAQLGRHRARGTDSVVGQRIPFLYAYYKESERPGSPTSPRSTHLPLW